MGDDSLRVPRVVGNNGAEWPLLPTAWLTGKMTIDQVLILPVYSHKALPNTNCITTRMSHTDALTWHEAEITAEPFVFQGTVLSNDADPGLAA